MISSRISSPTSLVQKSGSKIQETPNLSSYDTILKKHSIVISGHQTSITLENIFWDHLKAIADSRHSSLSILMAEIDSQRMNDQADVNLSSAVRVFVLKNHL